MSPEKAKIIADFLSSNLERECATTRRVLAALPDDQLNWQPHEKGMKAGELAWHIATSDCFFLRSVADGAFVMPGKMEQPATVAEIVAYYDENLPPLLERCKNLTPEEALKELNFRDVFVNPAVIFLNLATGHSIHHRGQLSTYLRAMGAKVPKIYGRSADEQ
jgi:uncharacterized damage-inducible protein DinB